MLILAKILAREKKNQSADERGEWRKNKQEMVLVQATHDRADATNRQTDIRAPPKEEAATAAINSRAYEIETSLLRPLSTYVCVEVHIYIYQRINGIYRSKGVGVAATFKRASEAKACHSQWVVFFLF